MTDANATLTDPSTWRPDESDIQLLAERGWLQGAIVSSVAYGGELVLFAMCFYLLASQTSRTNMNKNVPLLVYISTIVLLGTLFMGSLAEFTQLAFVDNRNYPGGPAQYETDMFSIPVDEMGNVSFVLANWLCDGLIVWRCMVIYKGCRLPLWAIMFFPSLVYLASITMGLLWLLQISASSPFENSTINWTVPYFTLSLSLNILVTIAIVARLFIYRYRISSVLGRNHGSQYTSIAAMIVESAAMFSVFSLLFLVPFAINSETSAAISQIFLQSMGQVQIIATLLIIFRVAQGKGWSSSTPSSLNNTSDRTGTSLRMGKVSGVQFRSEGSTAYSLGSSHTPKSPGITISRDVFTDSQSMASQKHIIPEDV